MQAKHLFGTLVLAVAVPLSATAGSGDKAEELIKTLNLQDDRAEQVRDILDTYHEQKRQIGELAHDQIRQSKELKMERLESVLTEEELEQYKSIMEQKKKQYKAHHGEGHMNNWKEKGKEGR